MKHFKTVHRVFDTVNFFDEENPPNWLIGGPEGSTNDMRWFYKSSVLTLEIGQTIETDFQTIKRIE